MTENPITQTAEQATRDAVAWTLAEARGLMRDAARILREGNLPWAVAACAGADTIGHILDELERSTPAEIREMQATDAWDELTTESGAPRFGVSRRREAGAWLAMHEARDRVRDERSAKAREVANRWSPDLRVTYVGRQTPVLNDDDSPRLNPVRKLHHGATLADLGLIEKLIGCRIADDAPLPWARHLSLVDGADYVGEDH